MSQAFFGDIVTLNGLTMWVTSLVSGVTVFILLVRWKSLTNHSFVIPIVGARKITRHYSLYLFNGLTLVIITTSIYSMGLLFTVAFLLIPTVVFSFVHRASVRLHMTLATVTAGISVLLGFVLSLFFDRISTVPTVVLMMVCIGILVLGFINKYLSAKHLKEKSR